MYLAEKYVVKKLYNISNYVKKEITDIEKHIDALEKMLNITYAENQRAAIRMSVENKVMVLTGGRAPEKQPL